MDPTDFVTAFPEFANTAQYPTAAITFWFSIATLRLNACRWGTLLTIGAQLFVAHYLVLELAAQKSAAFGAAPGLNTGAIAGKTVDKVSYTYSAESGSLTDSGNYNLTTYGTRFLELARMVGMGPVQA